MDMQYFRFDIHPLTDTILFSLQQTASADSAAFPNNMHQYGSPGAGMNSNAHPSGTSYYSGAHMNPRTPPFIPSGQYPGQYPGQNPGQYAGQHNKGAYDPNGMPSHQDYAAAMNRMAQNMRGK